MNGKTVVITGATSGIGETAALALARQGARIVFTARDRTRADALMAKLARANANAAHAFHIADLSTIASTRAVGAAIAAAEPKIDVLANNAGALFVSRGETADGLERTFAVNHMAYFVLTEALLANLKATTGARIVSTASEAHRVAPLDFDDLQSQKSYSSFGAYGRSKLCNIYFTQELSRRLEGSGVTAHCFHPGFVASNFATNNGILAKGVMAAAKFVALSPEKGADTLVWLASSPNAPSAGGGYYDRRKQGALAPFANDRQAAEKLWRVSEQIAAR